MPESMRPVLLFAAALMVGALVTCSKPTPPPGRWEGAYDSNGTMVVARVEIAQNGLVRLSAPDLSGVRGATADQLTAMRAGLAAQLLNGWDSVAPHAMDFDGTTFRKLGGIAPQMDWDKATGGMTLYLYFGAAPAVHVPLHPVNDFSDDPWPQA